MSKCDSRSCNPDSQILKSSDPQILKSLDSDILGGRLVCAPHAQLTRSGINMKRIRRAVLLVLVIAASVGAYYYSQRPPVALVLTGIVTTNDVIVSPQISGQISRSSSTKATWSRRIRWWRVIKPDELQQESAYYAHSAEGVTSQVRKARRRCDSRSARSPIRFDRPKRRWRPTESQEAAAEADLENARLTCRSAAEDVEPGHRTDGSVRSGENRIRRGKGARGVAEETGRGAAFGRSSGARKRRADCDPAKPIADQRGPAGGSHGSERQGRRAASPIRKSTRRSTASSTCGPCAVGEVVSPGQTIVTLINPDDLWVRGDVEEAYIDSVRIGDQLTVRLPSGEERRGHCLLSRC